VNRVKKLRVSAALVSVGAIALLSSAIPAAADPASGIVKGVAQSGPQVAVVDSDGKTRNYDTDIFDLVVGTEHLKTYCVDLYTDIDVKHSPGYVEAPWSQHTSPGFTKNAPKINWLLHNGYPQVSAADLQAKIGGKWNNGLSEQEALAATQAAAWHFSDNVNLDLGNPTPKDTGAAADVVSVYKYLTDEKSNVGIADQPKPELTLTPQKLTGKPGSLLGPFTVATNASNVVVSAKLPDGVLLADKDGNKLPDADAAKKALAASDKYDFYLKVPAGTADGKADITVKANATLTLGRLFVSPKGQPEEQKLILAKTDNVALETKGVAEWNAGGTTPTSDTPAPQPKNTTEELAKTGASIMAPVVIGVVLVAGGVGALLFQRRRRKV
jgi:TQXA domain-containing protein/LPXTG-motif cell wall-anchored protein